MKNIITPPVAGSPSALNTTRHQLSTFRWLIAIACLVLAVPASLHAAPGLVVVGNSTTIEAEDWKLGGEGVGSHDNTTNSSGNAGSYHRANEGVDVSQGGGEVYISFIGTNEWLAYDIEITESGNYDLLANVSVAPTRINRQLRFSSNGTDLTGAIVWSGTGEGQWKDVVKLGAPVYLASGVHELRVNMAPGTVSGTADQFFFNALTIRRNFLQVHAGEDFTLSYPFSSTTLDGEVSTLVDGEEVFVGDEGSESLMNAEWTQVSGIRHVTITDPYSPVSGFKVNGHHGSYTLRLTGRTNGNRTYIHDEVTVNLVDDTNPVSKGFRRLVSSTNATLFQAEDFRLGGQGVGCWDNTPGSSAGDAPASVKRDGVDMVRIDTDPEPKRIAIGWPGNGEWLSYNVNVEGPGYYTFTASVAAVRTNRKLNFKVGESTVTGTMVFGQTGGSEVFTNVTAGAYLEAGNQTLKLAMEESEFLVDSFTIAPQMFQTFIFANGTVNAEIVRGTNSSGNSTRAVKLAASQLETYLEKLTGAQFNVVTTPTAGVPVQIYVGNSTLTAALGVTNEGLKDGQFKMVSGPNYLVLLGTEADSNRIEPWAKSASNRPANLLLWDQVVASYWGNGTYFWEDPNASAYDGYNEDLDLWSGDGRGTLNAVFEFLRNLGVRWYFPGDEVVPNLALSSIGLPTINLTQKPQIPVCNVGFDGGKGFGNDDSEEALWMLRSGILATSSEFPGPYVHGMKPIMTRAQVKAAHSGVGDSFYALRMYGNGTYFRDLTDPELSSAKFFDDHLKYAITRFEHFGTGAINVMPPDAFKAISLTDVEEWLMPEEGEDGEMSNYVFDYANRMAAALTAAGYTDKWVVAGAYSGYRAPPVGMQMAPNVALTYTRVTPLWLSDHGWHAYYREMIEAWLDPAVLPSQRLLIYDKYYHATQPHWSTSTGGDTWWGGIPVLFPRLLADDMQYLRGKIKGYRLEAGRHVNESSPSTPHSLAANHLNLYVLGRLCWNPDIDIDALLDEYYVSYYGPAADEMATFIGYCEENWMNRESVATTSSIIAQMKILINDALAACPTDPADPYRKRVQRLKTFLDVQNPD